MSAPLLEARREGAVCVLVFRRDEKLNAFSSALEQELQDALASAAVRTSSCVLFTGGGRAFSAGADITEFPDRTPEAVLDYYRTTGRVYEDIAALPQPTLSAIHGYCLGAGLELALATDFRVADETAVFDFPEVALGILPSSGGTYRAVRLLGPARAKELILLPGRLTAAEALRAGLVTEVVGAGSALERALELAQALAALPPAAVAVAKQAIDATPGASREAALLIERLAYGLLAQTTDARTAADEFGQS